MADLIDDLRAFLALVLRDARDLGLDLRLEIVPGSALGEDPRSLYLRMQDGLTMLTDGDGGRGHAQERATLADTVHDWIVEELPALHQPTNWPPCSLHPQTHPLQVGSDGDAVLWVCPATGQAQAAVGELRD